MLIRPGWGCSAVRMTSAATRASVSVARSGALRQWTVTVSPFPSTNTPGDTVPSSRSAAAATTGRQGSASSAVTTRPSGASCSRP